ncbi:MAG TPA: B/F/G family RNA polymerase sigma-70 factor [Clostridiales bacterium UBA9856]|jgi:RNA polymerase sigma-B factor|nr:B/F/G family RNA polymerase sigma-70 factor [Clostridiales bacterium UBA9856]HOA42653.1 SigB/SigF/SigG family RNA polymerase sigma factor [Bacillota bacterium]HPZ59112.1 SigB/SigF/SigG family RNA polymerase sigma factor [Bacillota bacterium]
MTSQEKNTINELFEEYSRTKDLNIRNQIVEKYLYMVDILAKKFINKGVDYDDLYQIGSMALVFAVERFDPNKGYEFTSFATPTIIGEIKRYFRDKGWAVKVPRKWKEISAKLPAAKEALHQRLGRAPLVSEIAEYLGYSEEDILEAMESGQAYGTFSLQQTYDDGGNEGEASIFEKYTARDEVGYINFENSEVIKAVLNKLNDQERKVFRMRFFDEKTQQQIADEIGVSQMTVSRLEKKLRDKFREEYYR